MKRVSVYPHERIVSNQSDLCLLQSTINFSFWLSRADLPFFTSLVVGRVCLLCAS